MLIYGERLISALIYSIKDFNCSYIRGKWAALTVYLYLKEQSASVFFPLASLPGQRKLQCLAQGHFDTWTEGTEDQTTSTEPQLSNAL